MHLEYVHTPILPNVIQAYLTAHHPKTLVDLTLGEAGHAGLLLTGAPNAHLLGFDRDSEMLAVAEARLAATFPGRFTLHHASYAEAGDVIRNAERPLGLLADLGISSRHFDLIPRGFALRRRSDPLDMRLHAETDEVATAGELLNTLKEAELVDILRRYGEEKFAGRIAAAIVAARSRNKVWTVDDLVEAVWNAVPVSYRHGRIHPATRTFQALRIAVNDELGQLDRLLEILPDCLQLGDRLAFLTFHSLEDRPVKQFLKSHCKRPPQRADFKPGDVEPEPFRFHLPSGQPILPDADEQKANPRSSSAKLRLAEVEHLGLGS